jgi:hypothetical protein
MLRKYLLVDIISGSYIKENVETRKYYSHMFRGQRIYGGTYPQLDLILDCFCFLCIPLFSRRYGLAV